MKRDIRAAVAQFEARDGDKAYNLARIDALTAQAAAGGAKLVLFHECSITGYTFLETLSREELTALAEPVLKHRMALTFAARADGETIGGVIGRLTKGI